MSDNSARAIGVVGTVLGATGIVLTQTNQKKISELETTVENTTKQVSENNDETRRIVEQSISDLTLQDAYNAGPTIVTSTAEPVTIQAGVGTNTATQLRVTDDTGVERVTFDGNGNVKCAGDLGLTSQGATDDRIDTTNALTIQSGHGGGTSNLIFTSGQIKVSQSAGIVFDDQLVDKAYVDNGVTPVSFDPDIQDSSSTADFTVGLKECFYVTVGKLVNFSYYVNFTKTLVGSIGTVSISLPLPVAYDVSFSVGATGGITWANDKLVAGSSAGTQYFNFEDVISGGVNQKLIADQFNGTGKFTVSGSYFTT